MTAQEAFCRAYPNGGTNFMTPTIERRWTLSSGLHAELSSGTGMRNQPIWGATILSADGVSQYELSKGGFESRQDALDYIDEVAS